MVKIEQKVKFVNFIAYFQGPLFTFLILIINRSEKVKIIRKIRKITTKRTSQHNKTEATQILEILTLIISNKKINKEEMSNIRAFHSLFN